MPDKRRVIWIVSITETPGHILALALIFVAWFLYLFGLFPYFERNATNDIILAIGSIIFAVVCYTYGWWIRWIPRKLQKLCGIIGYLIAAILAIGLPLYLILRTN